ncbi:MAG: peptidase M3 [Hyphomonadaceae bacterium BRH_c29]|nr:MAG: peptidase M3 [Hyphomonadaceae bacterium BRH_c29]
MTRTQTFLSFILGTTMMTACAGITPEAADAAGPAELTADADDADIATTEAAWSPGDAFTGPYEGVPAFDKMDIALLKPALIKGMAAQNAEIDAITANEDAPTFENTIAAMEDAGREFNRVLEYYYLWGSNLSSPEFRDIESWADPEIQAVEDSINQNQALFARVDVVRNGAEYATLTPVQQRLTDIVYQRFTRNGGTLTGEKAEKFAAINKELAGLYAEFSANLLADEEGWVTYLTPDQTGGLPDSFLSSAAAAAEALGKPGMYAVRNTRSSMDPFLTYSTERDLRETVWRNYYNRGDNGDAHDNNALIAKILKLRDERVELLGYDNYAAWRLEDRMARTPERAFDLMLQVWKASVGRVHEEVADMQELADAEGAGIKIEPWDYRFYSEKVRKAKYDLDSEEVKQYLQLDNLRLAMFDVAGQLFGFEFIPITDGSVPVFHPDVTVYEVVDKKTGDNVGVWYFDPFARDGKRSGAWATTYRSHESFRGETNVLAANNANFVKPAPGEPVLVSWDDAETMFHEFGHALHYLSSKVEYPSLNFGLRDYTEFQSQLLERWLSTDHVINTYLVSAETGEPMPAELVEKIRKASTFNQGFATTEYLASALIDMKLHMADPEGLDPDKFERETLDELGMPSELVMRHRTPQFGHVFAGEGYAAGYYGYMWADVLTSDAAEAFAESAGGFYDQDIAAAMVKYLFAAGNSMDPAEAYRLFRGRDAEIGALMRDRGFAE